MSIPRGRTRIPAVAIGPPRGPAEGQGALTPLPPAPRPPTAPHCPTAGRAGFRRARRSGCRPAVRRLRAGGCRAGRGPGRGAGRRLTDHRRQLPVEGQDEGRSGRQEGGRDHLTHRPRVGRIYSVDNGGKWVRSTPALTPSGGLRASLDSAACQFRYRGCRFGGLPTQQPTHLQSTRALQ